MPVEALPFSPLFTPDSADRTFGILSTYPPTACGLATFSASLAEGLLELGAAVRVVRVADGSHTCDPIVVKELVNGSPASVTQAAAALGRSDLAVVQHEYGLYGGPDGEEVVEIVRRLTVPSIVVCHTVPLAPTANQKAVLEAVADAASALVVMSEQARTRLCAGYDFDNAKLATIPHGATPAAAKRRERPTRPVVLTWGLLGPGKGIERVIDAMTDLQDLRPRPRYVIAGRTHPKVLAREGDAYRERLVRQAWAQGVAPSITFDASYRDPLSLARLIESATVVVLPYDSHDQVTSGVLVDAVGAGKPVVATDFPHAAELLASGAGVVVAHDDAAGLAVALRRVLTEADFAAGLAAEAARLARDLTWPAVARQYLALADTVLADVGAIAR